MRVHITGNKTKRDGDIFSRLTHFTITKGKKHIRGSFEVSINPDEDAPFNFSTKVGTKTVRYGPLPRGYSFSETSDSFTFLFPHKTKYGTLTVSDTSYGLTMDGDVISGTDSGISVFRDGVNLNKMASSKPVDITQLARYLQENPIIERMFELYGYGVLTTERQEEVDEWLDNIVSKSHRIRCMPPLWLSEVHYFLDGKAPLSKFSRAILGNWYSWSATRVVATANEKRVVKFNILRGLRSHYFEIFKGTASIDYWARKHKL